VSLLSSFVFTPPSGVEGWTLDVAALHVVRWMLDLVFDPALAYAAGSAFGFQVGYEAVDLAGGFVC